MTKVAEMSEMPNMRVRIMLSNVEDPEIETEARILQRSSMRLVFSSSFFVILRCFFLSCYFFQILLKFKY